MNRPWLSLAWLIPILACPSWMMGHSHPLRVVGSHYLEEIFHANLSNEDNSIHYQMTSSLLGLLKIREGLADVAFVLQSPEEQPLPPGSANVALGYWGIFFSVHRDNPTTEIPLAGLSELLRKTRLGLRLKWGIFLPHEPDWANRPVKVTFGLSDNNPSYPILRSWFFQDEKVDGIHFLADHAAQPHVVEPYTLLVSSRLPEAQGDLRPLSLVQPGDSVGFPPSPENLFFGDYPLRCSLNLIVRDMEDPRSIQFLTLFFQSEIPKMLAHSGFVAVPDNAQNQALLKFDLEF